MIENLKSILIIEDDDLTFMLVSRMFPKKYNLIRATKISEVEKAITSHKIFMGFVDLDLEYALEGLDILKILKRKEIPSVILSARNDREIIHQAFKIGAIEYLQKPLSEKLLDQLLITQEVKEHKDEKQESRNDILNAVISPAPLLITGETGVGKTKAVNELYEIWKKVQINKELLDLPLIHINCSEFSETLLESELFGHVKGAFTGATKDKKGLLEQANNGILFLDEIGTITLNMQKKLLKAIEEKSFYPVGSEKIKHVDFKLIAATCDHLDDKVQSGLMREDFYHRISGQKIILKPLRERKNEIPVIIEQYIKKDRRNLIIDEEALDIISNYSWPGNIRELIHFMDRLFLIDERIINKEIVKSLIKESKVKSEVLIEKTSQPMSSFEPEEENFIREYGLVKFIEKKEKEILEKYLTKNMGKIRKTIEDLKISPSVFYRIKGEV